MRKAGAITVLLLLFAVCGACVAASSMYEAHDQVTLTETLTWGDRRAAEDLQLYLHTSFNERLRWETTAPLGRIAETATKYHFSATRVIEERFPQYDGIGLDSIVDTAFMDVEDMEDTEAEGIVRAYHELYAIVSPGEEKEKEIFLKDYLEFYPISVTANMPGTDFSIESSRLWDGQMEPGTESYVAARIGEFFKIPVLPDERWSISLGKNDSGLIQSMGSGSTITDNYYMWTYSVVAEDACYFTIENRSQEGRLMDMSHIPGGYGIYRLPYEEPRHDATGQRVCSADVDALSMVYPLDPEMDVMYLHLSQDGKKLLLHAVEGGIYTLTVIDIASMEMLQKIHVMEYGDNSSQLYDEGEFIVTMVYGDAPLTAAIIEQDENGLYSLAYTVAISGEDQPSFNFSDLALAFDGERLAMAGFQDRVEEQYRESCNPFVTVYDKSGMLYYGEYRNSLDSGLRRNHHSFRCFPYGMEPLQIAFES